MPPILQPGQLDSAVGEIPMLRLPPATLFANRARRLRQLAPGHHLAEYLLFVACLAEGQQHALEHHPTIPLVGADLLADCRLHARPPLSPAGWCRHPHWREVARQLAKRVYGTMSVGGRNALTPLLAADPVWLESQADGLLTGQLAGLDLAAVSLVGAALQVQWTHLARQLSPHQVGRQGQPILCPVCGSPPVASVIGIDGEGRGLRALHCALCGSDWHRVRSTCSHCETAEVISYYSIASSGNFVRAEACPACHSYLKLIHQDRAPGMDVVADDLASLGLDLLMGEKEYAKSGLNFFMIPGPEEQPPPQAASFHPPSP